LETVYFVDSVSGDTVNTFDVFSSNPYNTLSLPQTGKMVNGNVEYDLNGMGLDQMFGPILPSSSEEWKQRVNYESWKHEVILTRAVSGVNVHIQNGYLALVYSLRVFQDCGDVAGVSGYVILFNSAGNIVGELPQSSDGYHNIAIGPGAELIGYMTGDSQSHCYYGVEMNHNFSIYSIHNSEIIYSEPSITANGWISGIGTLGDWFSARYSKRTEDKKNIEEELRFIDPINRFMYSRTYSREEISNRLRNFSEGLDFKDPVTNEYSHTHFFQVDFQKTPF